MNHINPTAGTTAQVPQAAPQTTARAARVLQRPFTIVFEDHGQDFLRWRVVGGFVVECTPFQAWAWEGAQILPSSDLRKGGKVAIRKTAIPGRRVPFQGTINYPIERIERGLEYADVVGATPQKGGQS